MPSPPTPPAAPVLSAVRHGLRRYLSDLRVSRAFVAGEVAHTRWLNLGQFRGRNVSPGRAARAALRLAAVVGVAEVIAQAARLPRGYWAALTVLIVLRGPG